MRTNPPIDGPDNRLELRVSLPPIGYYSWLREMLYSAKDLVLHLALACFLILEVTRIFLSSLPRGGAPPSPFLSRFGLIIGIGIVVSLISALVFGFVGRLAKARRDVITYAMLTTNDKFFRRIENELLNSTMQPNR